jgi:two-component system, sensor histidine kinase YesM
MNLKKLLTCIARLLNDLNLMRKLVLSYFLLVAIPLLILGLGFFNVSSNIIASNAQTQIRKIVQGINENIDFKLSVLEEKTLLINIDKELFDIFSRLNTRDPYKVKEVDNRIQKILYKYFPNSDEQYSVNLVTSYFTFGRNIAKAIPRNGFDISLLCLDRNQYRGNLYWTPVFNYGTLFTEEELKVMGIDKTYLFSALREIDCSYIDSNGGIAKMSEKIERPVLMVNLREEIFSGAFEKNITVEGSEYYVLSKEGIILSHNNMNELGHFWSKDLFAKISGESSGSFFAKVNGEKMLFCFDTSLTTGWSYVIGVPFNKLLSTLPTLRFYTITIGIVILLLVLVIGYLISRGIMKPVNNILTAIQNMSEGNFTDRLAVEGNNEMSYLVKKFNEMNKHIHWLIQENYEVTLREKELQINALNLQFEPHFMYNTLSTINLMAVEKSQNEISQMILSLSGMLRYTVKNTKELVSFSEDLNCIMSYLHIMSKRLEGQLQVIEDIQPEIYECKVPRLFLQPLVENSILHGFDNMPALGVIRIFCRIEGNIRKYCIEDNGKGFDPDTLRNILDTGGDTGKIGIRNVNERIKAIYGHAYGITFDRDQDGWSRVTVIIPMEEKANKEGLS